MVGSTSKNPEFQTSHFSNILTVQGRAISDIGGMVRALSDKMTVARDQILIDNPADLAMHDGFDDNQAIRQLSSHLATIGHWTRSWKEIEKHS